MELYKYHCLAAVDYRIKMQVNQKVMETGLVSCKNNINIYKISAFPLQLKSKDFIKGCWYPKHKANIDIYVESRRAARNMCVLQIF